MSFLRAVVGGYQKSFTYSGRTARAEFWWFTLATALSYLCVVFLLSLLGDPDLRSWLGLGGVAVYYLFLAATGLILVPWVAAAVRRLHDSDLKGWIVLIVLVLTLFGALVPFLLFMPSGGAAAAHPLAGLPSFVMTGLFWSAIACGYLVGPAWILLLILLARSGTAGANRFG